MSKLPFSLITLALSLFLVQGSIAQSNAFRDSQAHIGLSAGLFSYHGPVSFVYPDRPNNRVDEHSLGIAITISTPIRTNRSYFRGVLGAANLDPDRDLFTANDNEFGYHRLGWFDAQVVFPLFRGDDPVLPYIFGGIGALVADPFRTNKDDDNLPEFEGREGPDRTVFALPVVGAGVDFALSRRVSLYLEGTYRFHWDFFVKSPNNPFDTSFLAAGLRFGLPSKQGPVYDEEVYIPPAAPIPTYIPPQPEARPCMYNSSISEDDPACVPPPPTTCTLPELNNVYFNFGSMVMDNAAIGLLDESLAEIVKNPACCVKIIGYTDEATSDTQALRISEQRARTVYNYLVARGVSPDRLDVLGMGVALPNCNKSDPGRGCRFNRRVELIPMDCDDLRFR